MHTPPCPVCQSATRLLDVVDFTKSCEELRGKYYVPIGLAIYYALCRSCHFCFAPAMHQWTPEDFKRHIYNDEYIIFDPDYREIRPNAQANLLLTNFQDIAPHRTHLDYGSGNGSLSSRLRAHGWASTAWDPFSEQTPSITTLGSFDLITAFEVFEHVPDIAGLMDNLSLLSTDHSLIFFPPPCPMAIFTQPSGSIGGMPPRAMGISACFHARASHASPPARNSTMSASAIISTYFSSTCPPGRAI